MIKRRILAGLLTLMMVLQALAPGAALAKVSKPSNNNLITIGSLTKKDYPQIDKDTALRVAREQKNKTKGFLRRGGASLFSADSPYIPGQQPGDADKPKYLANVTGKVEAKGLDGGDFDWNKIFGDKPIKLELRQLDKTKANPQTNPLGETGLILTLEVNKAGEFKLTDGAGNLTDLPLFSADGNPFEYQIQVDRKSYENVELIISTNAGTPGSKFEPVGDKQIATLFFKIGIQQLASTKFISEWHTGVAEAERPQIEGYFKIDDETDSGFNFPKNDTIRTILRSAYEENFEEDEEKGFWSFIDSELETTPETVEIKTNTTGLTFEENGDVKTVKSGDHKFKYDFTYDVIDGGKLTMTEILPVTFEANGGKFASIEEGQDQKIVKEVEYGKDLTDMPEDPTKDRETFKGWGIKDVQGKITPITEDAFKNIKEAKTLYAIWDNNDIVVEQLEVKESFKDGDAWVNNFIPTLDQLKGQVKIKDANGDPQALEATDTFEILDDSGAAITGDDLKNYLYEKLQEKDNPKDEPTRVETVKAKITPANGTSQTVDISIKVVKNIYEAMTETKPPYYVPKDYVKVTLDPTTKAQDPQKTYYYVNPKAKVVIPGKDPEGKGDNKFVKWTIGDTEYKLSERHQFDNETIIEAQYVSDVIPGNPDGSKPDTVPENYVKVSFVLVPEIGGEIGGTFKKDAITVYYVNLEKEVTIPQPETIAEIGYEFVKWKQDTTTPTKYEIDTTVKGSFRELDNIIPATNDDGTSNTIPDGYVTVTFTDGEVGKVHGKITSGKTVYYVNPKANKQLKHLVLDSYNRKNRPIVTPDVGYEFTGWLQGNNYNIVKDVTVPAEYEAIDGVIPKTNDDGKENEKPEGYVTVQFFAGPNGSLDGGNKTYYVNPKAGVTIGDAAADKVIATPTPKPDADYAFNKWLPEIDKTNPITRDQNYVAQFVYNPATVTLTYKAPDKTSGDVPGAQTVKKGDKVILADANTLKKDNATFKGWMIDGKEYAAGASVTLKKDSTATAVWTTNSHTVEFNTDGGTYIPSQKVAHGNKIKPVDPPTKPGHTFTGWTLDGSPFDPTTGTITGDTTLVANYVPNVVEQPDPNDPTTKPAVPENFVKVTVDPTDKATHSTKQVFWVNPNEVVQIPAEKPTGKKEGETAYVFYDWDRPLVGQFTEDTTITATYKKQTPQTPIFAPYVSTGVVATDLNKLPALDAYKDQIKSDKEFDLVEIVEQPKVNESGFTSAKIKIRFTENGMTKVVDVLVYVKPDPEIIEKPYPVPGDCNNSCDQPSKPNQPNQPNIGMDALNTTDHYQYLIGYPDGNFAPNRGMTRAEVATMFTRLLKERPVKGQRYYTGFSDIQDGDWYANTVGYAVQVGIVSGYPDGSFKPNKPITRAEFASIASRFDALAQGNDIAFNDLAPSHWGYNAIRSAATKGWISGYPDNTFRPEKAISRAEVTSITNRMLNRYADLYWIDAHRGEVIRFGDVKRGDWYFEPIMEATMGHDFIRDRDGKTEHWTGLNGKSFI